MFYTRFPVGNIKGWNETMLNKSTRYFPLVGIFVGGVAALVFFSAGKVFSVHLAVLLSMFASVFFTGAFHEDGFADFCDGFGGGTSPEKVLSIMKDSRIGTYGTVGLIFMLAAKWIVLSEFNYQQLPLIIIAGHSVSRVFPVILIYTSKYARLDATSKTKPVGKADSVFSFLFAAVSGLAILIAFNWIKIVVSISSLLLITFIFRKYIIRKIGGYTGDVLGALQQISEVVFYLILLALNV